MAQKKVSIIIPIYNSEQYLEQCLMSIKNQTYPFYEVLMINDGSTDESISICEKYTKDKRFKLIDKENTGVSNSRNIGIKSAQGDFIAFVDSDDWCSTNYLETAIKNMEKCDLLCFGYLKSYKNINKQIIISSKENISSQILDANSIGGYLWNKIFKKEIIQKYHIKFNEKIHYCEDLVFVKDYIDKIRKVNYINIPLYYYRMRKTSVSSNFYSEKSISILNAIEVLMSKYKNSKELYEKLIIDYIVNYYKLKKYINPSYKINYKILKKEKQIIKNMSKKEYLKFIIIKKTPYLTFLFRHYKDKIKKRNEYE